MPGNHSPHTTGTFPAELRSLYSLCLLSLVLGAFALAWGLRFIVGGVLAVAGSVSFQPYYLVEAFAGWAAAVIGFRWVISTGRIFPGVSGILRDYQALEGSMDGESREMAMIPAGPSGGASREDATPGRPVPDDLVLRMLASYRENWKTWWKMPLIAALGGWIFLCLGVLEFIDGYTAWQAGDTTHLSFLATGIAIALGIAALLCSSRFRTIARTWEHRLGEAGMAEVSLPEPEEQGNS